MVGLYSDHRPNRPLRPSGLQNWRSPRTAYQQGWFAARGHSVRKIRLLRRLRIDTGVAERTAISGGKVIRGGNDVLRELRKDNPGYGCQLSLLWAEHGCGICCRVLCRRNGGKVAAIYAPKTGVRHRWLLPTRLRGPRRRESTSHLNGAYSASGGYRYRSRLPVSGDPNCERGFPNARDSNDDRAAPFGGLRSRLWRLRLFHLLLSCREHFGTRRVLFHCDSDGFDTSADYRSTLLNIIAVAGCGRVPLRVVHRQRSAIEPGSFGSASWRAVVFCRTLYRRIADASLWLFPGVCLPPGILFPGGIHRCYR